MRCFVAAVILYVAMYNSWLRTCLNTQVHALLNEKKKSPKMFAKSIERERKGERERFWYNYRIQIIPPHLKWVNNQCCTWLHAVQKKKTHQSLLKKIFYKTKNINAYNKGNVLQISLNLCTLANLLDNMKVIYP